MSQKNRRSWFSFIDPRFQGQMLGLYGWVCIFQAGIFYFSTYYAFHSIENLALRAGVDANHSFFSMLATEKLSVLFILFIATLFSMAFFMLMCLRITHRASGAAFRIQRDFEKMEKQQQLFEIHLREKDFFQEVAASFNRLVQRHREPSEGESS